MPKPATLQNNGYRELPLPRDFSMLPENSQALLRAARLGIRKRADVVEDEKEAEETQNNDFNRHAGGLAMSKWTLVPRELEGQEFEYLAKRRKGLPSVYTGINGESTPMRRTKIRKTDPDGTTSVWEVLVPEGQSVEGEVVEEEASAVSTIPGTVVEGVGVVNAEGLLVAGEQITSTPARRKPPIPKKKKHGPGRGRKKALENPTDQTNASTPDGHLNGDVQVNGHLEEGNGQVKIEAANREDSLMPDAHPLEDEGSDKASEEGDEDREEGELSPSPTQTASPPTTIEIPEKPSITIDDSHLSDIKDPQSPTPDGITNAEDDTAMLVDSTKQDNLPPSQDNETEPKVAPRSSPDGNDEIEHQVGEPFTDELATNPIAIQVHEEKSPQVSPPTESLAVLDQSPDLQNPVSEAPKTLTDSNDYEAPAAVEEPAQDMEIETSAPQTLTNYPEPPPLPHIPPPSTPPLQRMSPPPPPQPSEQHRRVSVPSPQAPTPSPPTPIETTFPQDFSPKAPTMSPPTPIENDLDSSPETALADNKRRLEEPPPYSLDASSKPLPVQIPGLFSAPLDRQVEVEAAPQIAKPNYNAEIPHSHNPFDGLAPPEIPPEDRRLENIGGIEVQAAPEILQPKMNAEIPHDHNPLEGLQAPAIPPRERQLDNSSHEEVATFSDGDEDLFGTQEKRTKEETL